MIGLDQKITLSGRELEQLIENGLKDYYYSYNYEDRNMDNIILRQRVKIAEAIDTHLIFKGVK